MAAWLATYPDGAFRFQKKGESRRLSLPAPPWLRTRLDDEGGEGSIDVAKSLVPPSSWGPGPGAQDRAVA